MGMILLALAAAGFALFPEVSAQAARDGTVLCLTRVIPSLFPFFVLSSLAVSSGAAEAAGRPFSRLMRPLAGVSGAGAVAFLLGLLGGYPVGAKTVAALFRRGTVDRREAEDLLTFCCLSGPGFLLGFCGGSVFRSTRVGLALLGVHAVSAILTGMLLSRGSGGRAVPEKRKKPRFAAIFPAAVQESFASCGSVCAFVIFFSVAVRTGFALLGTFGIAPPQGVPYAVVTGFFEMTNGVSALSADRVGFVVCAALTGWGGCSVHAQTKQVIGGLSLRPYLRGKAVQTVLSVPLAVAVSILLF